MMSQKVSPGCAWVIMATVSCFSSALAWLVKSAAEQARAAAAAETPVVLLRSFTHFLPSVCATSGAAPAVADRAAKSSGTESKEWLAGPAGLHLHVTNIPKRINSRIIIPNVLENHA